VAQEQTLNVRYTGVVPSAFVDAAVVMLVGELRDQEFIARRLAVRVPG
jgi:cytochrome c-type biogenesis protein CcmE